MNVQVTKDNVTILSKDNIHEGEYRINELSFDFSEEYTSDLVINAVFTNELGNAYQISVIDEKCHIPAEILDDTGQVVLGVYAYQINGEELELRYSPFPTSFVVLSGSYNPTAEESQEITPSQFEQYMQALNEGLNQVKESINELNSVTDNANKLIDEITQKLENGDFKGDTGATGADGKDGVSITTITTGTPTESEGYTITPMTINKSDDTNQIVNISAKNGQDGGVSTYAELGDKPSINGVELVGNKTTEDLGIVSGKNYTAGTNIEITEDNVINNTIPYEENVEGNVINIGQITKSNNNNVNIGLDVENYSNNAVLVGNNTYSAGANTLVIGNNAHAQNQGSIVLGHDAITSNQNQFTIGSSTSPIKEMRFNNDNATRIQVTDFVNVINNLKTVTLSDNQLSLGSTTVPINEIKVVTSEGDKYVATTDLIESLETRIAALEAKITELEGGN